MRLLFLVLALSSTSLSFARSKVPIFDSVFSHQDPLVYTSIRNEEIAAFCRDRKIPYLCAYEEKPGNFTRFAQERRNFTSDKQVLAWLKDIPADRAHVDIYSYPTWKGRAAFFTQLQNLETRYYKKINVRYISLRENESPPAVLKKLFTYYQRTENSTLYIIAPGYFSLSGEKARSIGIDKILNVAKGTIPLERKKESYIPQNTPSLIKEITRIFLPFPVLLLIPFELAGVLTVLFLLGSQRGKVVLIVAGGVFFIAVMVLAPFASGGSGGFLSTISAFALLSVSLSGGWVFLRAKNYLDTLSKLAQTHMPEVEIVETLIGFLGAAWLLFICREPVRYVGDLLQSTHAAWWIWLVIGLILSLPRFAVIILVSLMWKVPRIRLFLLSYRARIVGILLLLQLVPLFLFYGTTT